MYRKTLSCLTMSLLAATAAHAANVTKSYEVTSYFNEGPLSQVVTSFDITFNPAILGSEIVAVSNYVTTGGVSFADPRAFFTNYPASSTGFFYTPGYRGLAIYGALNNSTALGNTNDFNIGLELADDDSVASASASYTAVGLAGVATGKATARLITTPAVVPAAAAVPEPASWAMMIGGFGMVGTAMRRRQRTRIRFA